LRGAPKTAAGNKIIGWRLSVGSRSGVLHHAFDDLLRKDSDFLHRAGRKFRQRNILAVIKALDVSISRPSGLSEFADTIRNNAASMGWTARSLAS
jgi:hypothetical protein